MTGSNTENLLGKCLGQVALGGNSLPAENLPGIVWHEAIIQKGNRTRDFLGK